MTGVALAEELLLLAYDDETGKATMPRISLDLGMAAAVLVELALAGRVAYADGNLAVVDPAPTGEPIADAVLAKIAADTPHTPSSWVQRLRHGLRDRILSDLCGRGVVRDVDETELGFIHVHRYPVADASVEADIRQRLAEALTSGQLPDERTAALATLVAVLRMEPALGLTGPAAEDAGRRLEEIAAGAGFSGTVSLDDSVVRPSISLVIAALGQAVDAALGKRPAAS
ncbi:GPP34 family phosphoprotein [Micromonospora tulbaghiae]|uniref:GOLPH3/VPS74 family protein n=1 Tax=Micromonospora TaxID=1873 RepID=UPI00207D2AFA|nr:GPP34 family phosphoprotein [Micromonospora sp. CPM1]MCO1617713.1 GPP34 family phosphoprotein [Micromonospora sp. CPM1]